MRGKISSETLWNQLMNVYRNLKLTLKEVNQMYISIKNGIPPHIDNHNHSLPKDNKAAKQQLLLHYLQHDLKAINFTISLAFISLPSRHYLQSERSTVHYQHKLYSYIILFDCLPSKSSTASALGPLSSISFMLLISTYNQITNFKCQIATNKIQLSQIKNFNSGKSVLQASSSSFSNQKMHCQSHQKLQVNSY